MENAKTFMIKIGAILSWTKKVMSFEKITQYEVLGQYGF